MRSTNVLAVSAFLAVSQMSVYAGSFTDATHSSGLGTMAYRVYFPDNYQASGPNKTPVVLYLHSAAERGDSVNDILSNSYGGSLWTNDWITHLIDETQHGDHQAVLVMPQSGLWQTWNSMTAGDNWTVGSYTDATAKPISPRLQLAVDILDSVVASNNVNTNKVYVTGPSMGGYGTWDAIARFPEKFAAAAPLAGGGNTDLARSVLNTKPVWAFHGGADSLVPPSGTTNMYFASKQAGGSPVLSYLASEGHGGFDKFYTPDTYTVDRPQATGGSGPDLYEWMFAQDLSSPTGGQPIEPGNAPIVIGFGGGSTSNSRTAYTANGAHFIAYNYVEAGNITDLHDINNAATGISITRSGGPIGAGGGSPTLGPTTGDQLPLGAANGLYTYGKLIGQNPQVIFTLAGLDDERSYRIDILGTAAAPAGIHSFTRYILTGETTQSGEVDVVNNTDTFVTFNNVSPTGGLFTLTIEGVGADVGYISAVSITPVAVPEPGAVTLLAIGATALISRRSASRRS